MRARLIVAVTASLVVVAAAPFVGQLRGAIQSAYPGQYRHLIAGVVIGVVALATLTAAARIRDRRLLRYGLLASAVGGGLAYVYLTRTGNPDVDAVEWFHFVEYGLLTLLFHRVWRDREDLTALVFPVLAGILVGTLDEAFQWFIPARVGELRDVFLNGAAIVCGVAFAVGVDPPRRLNGLTATSRRSLACGLAVVVLGLALFVQTVHLGYEVRDTNGGSFRSRFTADDLARAARDRLVAWRDRPPSVLRPMSREDQYLAEGLWHVAQRNGALSGDDAWTAWRENLILETVFAPVLDVATYLTPSGARWSSEQRAQVSARIAGATDRRRFASTASPVPIYTWNRYAFLAVVAVIVAVVLAAGVVPTTRASAP